MTSETSIKLLQTELLSALKLIEERLPIHSEGAIKQGPLVQYPGGSTQFAKSTSLLNKCDQIVEQYQHACRPRVRVIHHLACSGGTLITKCISALPNLYVLSEVHPLSTLGIGANNPAFSPTDLMRLARFAHVPKDGELSRKLFVSGVTDINQHVLECGGLLILRDHSHSDFCVGEVREFSPAVAEILSDRFEVCSLVTIRDPVDAYMALVKNGWLHFSPSTFDDYCVRVLAFLDSYSAQEIIRYEDFVSNPIAVMKQICRILEIPYSEFFEDIFSQFRVTGDSGRRGEVISRRPRQKVDEELAKQVEGSQNYLEICRRGYYSQT